MKAERARMIPALSAFIWKIVYGELSAQAGTQSEARDERTQETQAVSESKPGERADG